MQNLIQKKIELLIPWIIIGIFLTIFFSLFFILAHIIWWGLIIGCSLWGIQWLSNALFAKPLSFSLKRKPAKTGRIFDHEK